MTLGGLGGKELAISTQERSRDDEVYTVRTCVLEGKAGWAGFMGEAGFYYSLIYMHTHTNMYQAMC